MAAASVAILGRVLDIACAEADVPRIQDLARALDARLEGLVRGGEPDAIRQLSLVALALTAENQAVRAALARAQAQLDRLNEALAPPPQPRPPLRTVARA